MTLVIICFFFGGACLIAAARMGYTPEDEMRDRPDDRRHVNRLADRSRKGNKKRCSQWG